MTADSITRTPSGSASFKASSRLTAPKPAFTSMSIYSAHDSTPTDSAVAKENAGEQTGKIGIAVNPDLGA
jgi:hypothetical protein